MESLLARMRCMIPVTLGGLGGRRSQFLPEPRSVPSMWCILNGASCNGRNRDHISQVLRILEGHYTQDARSLGALA